MSIISELSIFYQYQGLSCRTLSHSSFISNSIKKIIFFEKISCEHVNFHNCPYTLQLKLERFIAPWHNLQVYYSFRWIFCNYFFCKYLHNIIFTIDFEWELLKLVHIILHYSLLRISIFPYDIRVQVTKCSSYKFTMKS